MEENKVIFRKPFNEEANQYCVNEIEEIGKALKVFEENKGNSFIADVLSLVNIRFRFEQIAKKWGFNSFEDMNCFVEAFGVENLTNYD